MKNFDRMQMIYTLYNRITVRHMYKHEFDILIIKTKFNSQHNQIYKSQKLIFIIEHIYHEDFVLFFFFLFFPLFSFCSTVTLKESK